MPIDTKIGRPKRESEALSSAKGKSNHSYANTFFGTVNDLFYEFGVINHRSQKKNNDTDEKE